MCEDSSACHPGLGEAQRETLFRQMQSEDRISTAMRSAETPEEMFPRYLDETLAVLGLETGAVWIQRQELGDDLVTMM